MLDDQLCIALDTRGEPEPAPCLSPRMVFVSHEDFFRYVDAPPFPLVVDNHSDSDGMLFRVAETGEVIARKAPGWKSPGIYTMEINAARAAGISYTTATTED